MRIRIYLIFFLLIFKFLLACKPSADVKETSPKFYFPTDSVFTTYNDTLLLKGSNKAGYSMDSIAAGDTAFFRVEVDGVFHALTEVNITLSDSAVAALLYPDEAYPDSMFLPSSDYAGGKFILAGKKTRIPFTFMYHAKKADKNINLTVSAISEAPAESGVNRINLKVPIKKTPAPKFHFSSDTIYTDMNDTLQLRYVSPVYRMDALSAGDAARLTIIVDGVRNKLKQLKITPTNYNDANIILPDKSELDKLFLSTSDYENGIFNMDSTFSVLSFPFKLQAKNGNENFGISFEVTSDAPYDYGKSKFELKTPIQVP